MPFWRMPPLIPNNAADGPSLVRDVARSELVPGRGGTGTRTPLPPRERDLQLCFRYYYRIMALKEEEGRGKPKGWSIPRCPPTSRLWSWGQRAPFQEGTVPPPPRGTCPSPPRGAWEQLRCSWHSPAKGIAGGRGRGGTWPFLTPGCSWVLAPTPAPPGLSPPPGIN